MTFPGAQVHSKTIVSTLQLLKRQHVRVGKIVHVDVVANTGAVRSWVIVTIDPQLPALRGCFERQRNEVGLGFVQFANFPALIGAGSVEIPKAGEAQAVCWSVGLESIFECQLCATIRIHRLPRRVFRDRDLGGFAVNRTTGRKHEIPDPVVDGRIQQRKRARNIVREILSRILHRLADVGVCREMHDRIGTVEYGVESGPVGYVAQHQFKTVSEKPVPGRKIVIDNNLIPGPPQRPRRMTADITRAAGNENGHGKLPFATNRIISTINGIFRPQMYSRFTDNEDKIPNHMTSVAVLPTRERTSVPETRRFYRPELDCLRFFAFFGVFVFHTVPPQTTEYYAQRHIPAGWLIASASRAGSFGVDLFFLLSAYLITELLLREKEECGKIHLKAFYARRVLRIWPLYFLGIFIAILLHFVDADQRFPVKYVAAFLLLSGNWLTSLVGAPGSVMNPLWSVSFEEQFYLLWPTIVSKARRSKTLVFAACILLVLAQVGRFLLLKYARHSEVAVFTNTIARLDPLALGILTAVLTRNGRLSLCGYRRLLCLCSGCLLWLTAGHYFRMSEGFMVLGYPAMAVGAWLMFVAVLDAGIAPNWLRYLGKISYGLYVFHMLCLYIVEKLIGGYARNFSKFLAFWWVGLAMTIAVAALSYSFFESPFLRLKERFAFVKSRPV